MAAVVVERDDLYVLNYCSRYLARAVDERRHDYGHYAPDDARAALCEAWRFPVIDSHGAGASHEQSYRYNDVTFVHDAREAPATDVAVVGTFTALHEAVPMRPVTFLAEPSGFWSVTVRVPKAQVHTYKLRIDGQHVLDPVNPQQSRSDDGRWWSRFFTDGCQVPLVLGRRERGVLGRLVAHLLPFRLPENRRFVREVYETLDKNSRTQQFPLAYRLDEEVGVVNYIDKVLARAEQHHADDYRACLKLVDDVLRARYGGLDPVMLPPEAYEEMYEQMGADDVPGWDTSRYGSPRHFLLLLRRHAMTGAFTHPKSGGNSGGAGWAYLEERFRDAQGQTLFDWRRALEAPLGRNTDYRG